MKQRIVTPEQYHNGYLVFLGGTKPFEKAIQSHTESIASRREVEARIDELTRCTDAIEQYYLKARIAALTQKEKE